MRDVTPGSVLEAVMATIAMASVSLGLIWLIITWLDTDKDGRPISRQAHPAAVEHASDSEHDTDVRVVRP